MMVVFLMVHAKLCRNIERCAICFQPPVYLARWPAWPILIIVGILLKWLFLSMRVEHNNRLLYYYHWAKSQWSSFNYLLVGSVGVFPYLVASAFFTLLLPTTSRSRVVVFEIESDCEKKSMILIPYVVWSGFMGNIRSALILSIQVKDMDVVKPI